MAAVLMTAKTPVGWSKEGADCGRRERKASFQLLAQKVHNRHIWTSTSEMLQGPLAGTVACMAVVHQERIDACFGGLLWEHLHC